MSTIKGLFSSLERAEERIVRRGFVACLLVVAVVILPRASSPAGVRAQSTNPLVRGWEHALLKAPGGPGQPLGHTLVLDGGPGLLAFASVGGHPLLWSSTDGRSWQSEPLPAFQSGESPTQLYAVGRIYIVAGSGGPGKPLIWASDDEGVTWHESPDPFYIGALASGGDGLIAFSQHNLLAPGTDVWTSADGLLWRAVPEAAAAFSSAWVHSVARTSGGLVAVGMIYPPGRAAIWSSVDGRTWTQAPDDGGIFDGFEAIQVVVGLPGILAFGYGRPGQTQEQVAWVSPDGVHWRQAVTPFYDSNEGEGQVVPWQGGFVQFVSEARETIVWSSVDGLTWIRPGSDELFGGSAQVESAVAFQGGVAAIGTFALHPQPSCQTAGYPFMDLRTFQLATFLWSPSGSQSSPRPTADPWDPRALKLLPSDIYATSNLASTSFDAGSAYSSYVDVCPLDPALGPHRAYRLDFNDPQAAAGGGGTIGAETLSIVTATSTAAGAGFRHLARLLVPSDGTLQRKRELRASVHIGSATRVFRLRLQFSEEGSDFSVTQFAVAWRKGRVIGVTRAGNQQEAIRLAQRQLARLAALQR